MAESLGQTAHGVAATGGVRACEEEGGRGALFEGPARGQGFQKLRKREGSVAMLLGRCRSLQGGWLVQVPQSAAIMALCFIYQVAPAAAPASRSSSCSSCGAARRAASNTSTGSERARLAGATQRHASGRCNPAWHLGSPRGLEAQQWHHDSSNRSRGRQAQRGQQQSSALSAIPSCSQHLQVW